MAVVSNSRDSRFSFIRRKSVDLRLRVARAVGMAEGPPKAGERGRWRSRAREERRRGRWRGGRAFKMPATAGIAGPGLPRSRSSRVLFRPVDPETRDSRHPTVLGPRFLAKQEPLGSPRLPSGLSRAGQRGRGTFLLHRTNSTNQVEVKSTRRAPKLRNCALM